MLPAPSSGRGCGNPHLPPPLRSCKDGGCARSGGCTDHGKEAYMDDLWTVRRFAKWKYGTDEPTKAQENSIRHMCQDGTLPAAKVGREWRIDTMRILEGVRNGI